MSLPIRVLIVEDTDSDLQLILRELRTAGLDCLWERVVTADEFRVALRRDEWDLVLCDYSLPQFGAMEALEIVGVVRPGFPLIVVSGTMGEEVAVEVMRAGANDYFLKQDLSRLGPAVLREVNFSRKHRATERLSQEVLDSLPAQILVLDMHGQIVTVNTSWREFAARFPTLGSAEPGSDLLKTSSNLLEICATGELPFATFGSRIAAGIKQVLNGEATQFSLEYSICSGRAEQWYLIHVTAFSGDSRGVVISQSEITTRRITEAALRESEDRYRTLLNRIPVPLFVYDCETLEYLAVNDAAVSVYGYTRQEFLRMRVTDIRPPEDVPVLLDALSRWANQDGPRGVWRHKKKDGTIIQVEITAHLFELEKRPACIILAADVTARRRSEADLRHKTDLLRAVADGTPDAIFVKDQQGRYLLFNPAAARFVGKNVEAVLGKDDTELFDPEGARLVMERDRRVMELNRVETQEEQLTAAGVTRTYLATKGPYRDSHGQVIGVMGVSRDITETKQAEEALRLSEARFRGFMDHSPAAAWICDLNGQILYTSETYRRMFQLPLGDIVGCNLFELFPADLATIYLENIREVFRTNQVVSAYEPAVRFDGTPGKFLVYKFPLPHPDGQSVVGGVALDVTDQSRADGLLSIQKKVLEQVIADAPLTAILDEICLGIEAVSEGMICSILLTNEAGTRLTKGAAPSLPSEYSNAIDGIVIGPTVGSCGTAAYRRTMVVVSNIAQDPLWDGYRQLILPYGFNSCWSIPVLSRDGKVLATFAAYYRESRAPRSEELELIQAAARLVALAVERRRAEDELRLRDRAIRAATQGILITDPNRHDNPIIFASHGFERLTGYSEAEVKGLNCRVLQGEDTDPSAIEQLRAAIATESACSLELLNYRKDRTPFWNELSISPVRDNQGKLTHFVGVLADVTARRRLEEQFRQSQKMEAFGQLAGGVAHDFNNLLTVIIGYSDILLESLDREAVEHNLVAEILNAGERAASLTRQLLAFSRKQVLQPIDLDLNSVTLSMEKMLGRLISENIQLTTVLEPNLASVRADPGQVEQVILNLVVNARDAMPNGGRVIIETRNVCLNETFVKTRTEMQPGNYVLLTVRDTGEGIPEEIQSRIFEPFFTTKGVGKGTGLGLATVHGILRQSGGFIEVESQVGVGTAFHIYLPRAEKIERGVTPALGMQTIPRGSETVLLVEDEPGVRSLVCRVLRGCGYQVIEASNGITALDLITSHSGPIHLLITDVVMPGMGGWQVAEAIRNVNPIVDVLFISGYTGDDVVRHGVQDDGANFLQKPFSSAALAAKVREILDAKNSRQSGGSKVNLGTNPN